MGEETKETETQDVVGPVVEKLDNIGKLLSMMLVCMICIAISQCNQCL